MVANIAAKWTPLSSASFRAYLGNWIGASGETVERINSFQECRGWGTIGLEGLVTL